MEALYLLCSATSTVATSFALSLRLLFRCLYSLIVKQRKPYQQQEEDDERAGLSLYEGTVWHERRRPVRHAFKYGVRYALVDLDRAHGALPSSFFANHLSAHQARRITSTTGPVLLLTIPASVGYEQNPLSVYYCYSVEGEDLQLKKCIAEVTNTPWGETVCFTFDPESDLVAKPLHVSPFMDMLGNWSIRANAPGTNISLVISVQHPKLGDYFTATLTAKRVSSWTSETELFFWLMPHKVALWIYLQALNLWWKNVQFLQHPRYHNHDYREQAELRDRKLRCSLVDGQDENGRCKLNCIHLNSSSGTNEDRWFVWRDARWPWK